MNVVFRVPDPLSLMRPAEARFGWTDEAIETLTRLCADGHSASQIALEMGIASREAVIGKARRLGIKLHGKQTNTAAPRIARTVPTGRSKTQNSHPVGRSTDQGLGAVAASAPSGAITLRPTSPGARVGQGVRVRSVKRARLIERDTAAPESLWITILDLSESTCRWPKGDPADQETFAYCGAQVERERSYCPHHCRLAYVGTGAAYAKSTERNQWLMKA